MKGVGLLELGVVQTRFRVPSSGFWVLGVDFASSVMNSRKMGYLHSNSYIDLLSVLVLSLHNNPYTYTNKSLNICLYFSFSSLLCKID